LGGIGGPLLGSLLVTSGLPLDHIFYMLVGIALFDSALTLLVPLSRSADQVERTKA
jgi:AAHS family benzoate transporter-like MFS transporter